MKTRSIQYIPSESPPKIAIVTPYYLPVSSGIEVYIAELVNQLKKKYSITIYASGCGPRYYDGVSVRRYRSLDCQFLTFQHKLAYPFPFMMYRDLMTDEIDLINAHGHEVFTSYLAALAAKKRRIPLVLTVHSLGVAYTENALVRLIRTVLDPSMIKLTVRSAESVIAVNRSVRDYVHKYKPKRVTVIYHGVDNKKFYRSYCCKGPVAFVGRLIPTKAPDIFIRAIPKVLKEIETNFLVVGGGPLLKGLIALAKKLGVLDRLKFTGEIDHEQVASVLRNSSVVVAYVGGLVLLEAMAMMKPVVTLRSSWSEEIAGNAAYYVRPGDPDGTASAILSLLKNPNLSRSLAENGFNRITKEFSWETVSKKYEEVFSRLIETSKSPEKENIEVE